MKRSVKAFFKGIGVFLAGALVIFVMGVAHLGDVLGASPTHKPGDGKALKMAATFWFAGTYLTRALMDAAFFGGRMPAEGSKTDAKATEKEWETYHREKARRGFAYGISWVASPLLFGVVFWLLDRVKQAGGKAPREREE